MKQKIEESAQQSRRNATIIVTRADDKQLKTHFRNLIAEKK